MPTGGVVINTGQMAALVEIKMGYLGKFNAGWPGNETIIDVNIATLHLSEILMCIILILG
jgi:hypothetical protein